MSAWKEWQLALKDDSVSEEECEERKREWEMECRECEANYCPNCGADMRGKDNE